MAFSSNHDAPHVRRKPFYSFWAHFTPFGACIPSRRTKKAFMNFPAANELTSLHMGVHGSTKFILRGLEIPADDKLALRNALGTKWLVTSFDKLSKKLNFSNVSESFSERFSPWHGLARIASETLANQLLHLHTKVFLFNPLCCWMHSLMSNNALAFPVHIFQTFAHDAVKGFFSRKAFSSF